MRCLGGYIKYHDFFEQTNNYAQNYGKQLSPIKQTVMERFQRRIQDAAYSYILTAHRFL